MAPSEFDLRAALAEGEGEGDGLNANLLIRAGRARRAQRRSRFLTTAAVVVLAAGSAVGVSQLGDGSTSSTADSAAAGGNAYDRQAEHGSSSSDYQYAPSEAVGGGLNAGALSSSAAKARLAEIGCPSLNTTYSLVQDAAQSTGSAAHAPLFRAALSSAVVCAYGSTVQPALSPQRGPARLELIGTAARRLATSMENAGSAPNPGACGQGVANRYAVVGVGDTGAPQRPVTVDLVGAACAPVVTNGSAVRYDWLPPPDLARRISALVPMRTPDSPNPSPSPTN